MRRRTISLVALSAVTLTMSACAEPGGTTQQESNSGSDKTTIIYAKSQGPYTELFEDAIVPILEDEGYTVEGVDFSDLLTADIALNDGEVDVNVEQHTAYIEDFNANYDADLVPISAIPTVPAGIYSSTHSTLDEMEDGASVAVPNDASNTARAYLLLQKIGWIEVNPDADVAQLTQDDITANPHNLEFTEMKSLTIPPAMDDFDYVVITGSIVYNANIDPTTALATEDIQDHLVLQVTVKAENADAPWAQAIVDAYQSDEFKEYMANDDSGLWWIPPELQ
ncbi:MULTISPECIES: MetQ/NlpA family ABC transporter substrate-binding protein [unclassified Actinobaculum]|uniref:MetQ/NlpA family ABC transporter substrate-binding protein n=1 Tax=unclassified Actinobaculum TaxID=2609299 RepID=UPI000D52690D|nr:MULTISPECIES: MetQ/NlpA family ABC transporter substrate-binding protein [unclassified Actinobaculum]AWE42363.1 metal ABC transporter substrate-binding protein [Actinobaculum sp. 313]RTE50942.1 metal ABC transporter substrate-binding protein [Actinobaculum sp. 352]